MIFREGANTSFIIWQMKTDKILRKNIKILYEDNFVVLVDKPPHISVTRERWDKNKISLQDLFPELLMIHRLDKETSGILLLAKDKESAKRLSKQFEQRAIEKIYYALLNGEIYSEHGKINLPIAQSIKKAGIMQISKKGKPALTEYFVLERFKGFTWCKVFLHTGRTHQIRIHFKAIGHPLAVDSIYGKRKALFLSEFKPNYRKSKRHEEFPLLDRVSLHAGEIRFLHPKSNELLNIKSEIPKDLKITLKHLRKYIAIEK